MMKLEEQVKKSILQYPSLYKANTYQESRLKVLNQIFLTIGNGYEWALTKDPKKGGYLTDTPKYYCRGMNEGERKLDPPYGKEKCKEEFSDNYFNNKIFYISGLDYKKKIVSVTTRASDENSLDRVLIEISGLKDKEENESEFWYRLSGGVGLVEAKAEAEFCPYPISNYSAIMELYTDTLFIQADWLQGAVDVAREARIYFSTKERFKNDVHYPTKASINSDKKTFEERFNKEGQKGVNELRKIWGYKEGQTIEERKQESWNKYYTESVNFLEKFLEKYNKQWEE